MDIEKGLFFNPEEERKVVNMEINDQRKEADPRLREALKDELLLMNFESTSDRIYRFFGNFSETDPSNIKIQIADGQFGTGEAKNSTIIVKAPDTNSLFYDILEKLQEGHFNVPENKLEETAGKLILSTMCSTILHESCHALLNSKPGSKFSEKLKELSGSEYREEDSTLLDEGLAYAIQGFYAPEIEYIGSLKPRVNENDREIVKKRKILGEKMLPKVEEYIGKGKPLDDNFLLFSVQKMSEIKDQNP